MLSITDQTGRPLSLRDHPQRIISLVPSQTELLHAIGLEDEVVGITKFCIHPASWFRSKIKVGGTKKINFNQVHALHPDLIIANKEENEKGQVEKLAEDYPVWVSDIHHLKDALNMINTIGYLTGKTARTGLLKERIRTAFSELPSRQYKIKTAYLIWQNPYMTIGGDTFISAMLQEAGFENIFSSRTRYPVISIDELIEREPELVLLSSEPYPFSEKHISPLQKLMPKTKIACADGEMFSWYGSRLEQAPAYFNKLYKALQGSFS
ncbi:MAG: ABC transporter substrate-binding protein [Terrimonas sp.]|nr:ABC transporter substrate-binding protein [Terrimonas sp.]